MGDVIPIRPDPSQIELARNLLNGLPDLIESLSTDESTKLLRDLLAERVGEAHDILQDYIETKENNRDH